MSRFINMNIRFVKACPSFKKLSSKSKVLFYQCNIRLENEKHSLFLYFSVFVSRRPILNSYTDCNNLYFNKYSFTMQHELFGIQK